MDWQERITVDPKVLVHGIAKQVHQARRVQKHIKARVADASTGDFR